MENSRSKSLAWKKCECWAYWEMKSLKSCKMCTNPDLSVGSGWTVCCIECVSFHSLCCRHKLVLNFLISRWLPSACTPAYLLTCHPALWLATSAGVITGSKVMDFTCDSAEGRWDLIASEQTEAEAHLHLWGRCSVAIIEKVGLSQGVDHHSHPWSLLSGVYSR